MRQIQPVLWTKGVLLSPQHMQTQDRFFEDLLGFHLSSLVFSDWGVSRLDIDREALSGGNLAISAATGIFPDGMPFDIPGADPAPAPRSLEDRWTPDQETLDIYLAIPEYRLGGYNISLEGDDRGTRFMAEVTMRRDENNGLAEKPIQIARKNFRFLTEGDSLEGSSVLKIARVLRNPTGDYQLDATYIPPLIDIAANEYTMAMVRRLVEILTAKSGALSQARRHQNRSLAQFGISDVASFWLLYTVNSYLPQLRHLYEIKRGHPADLYKMMIGLAGTLSTFSAEMKPPGLAGYDHSDLSNCLVAVDERLRELLETVVPQNYVSLPMKPVKPSIFATAIDHDRYLNAPEIYLALNARMNKAELLQKAPQLIKVSSADQIEQLIAQALPGLELSYLESPPGAIPLKLDYHYFRLNRGSGSGGGGEGGGSDWDSIKLARNVSAYVPSDFPEARLELVVILPAE